MDVGASSFKKPLFSKAFKNAFSIGFEPDERSSEDFLDTKKIGNFVLYPVVLSDIDGEITLFLTKKSHCSSILRPLDDINDDRYTVLDEVEIPSKRLDSLNLKADIIKIDVQGAEKYVISGGINTIKDSSLLVCELFFSKKYNNQTTFEDLRNLVEPLGFIFVGFSSIYIKKDAFGLIDFADAIFINVNKIKSSKVNIFFIISHAIENDYLSCIELKSLMELLNIFDSSIVTIIKFIENFKFKNNNILKA